MIIDEVLARATARCHVLDVASVLRSDAVDVLRQAANATIAGPDWYLLPAAPALSRRAPMLVRVHPIEHVGPLRCEIHLGWRRMAPIVERRGEAILHAVALATGPRALTELSLLHPRRSTFRRESRPPTRRAEAALHFLASLTQELERHLSLARGER